jgi:hypothetical protein
MRYNLVSVSLVITLSLGSVVSLGLSSAQAHSNAAQTSRTNELAAKNSDGTWAGLSPLQQKTLAPLESDWDYLPPTSRKKWIQVANLYPKMNAQDQQRLQSRMNSWSNLSQKDRRIARENYLSSLKFPADKKVEAWSAYQKLSDEEKQKLAQLESGKKRPSALTAPSLQQHPVNSTMTSQLPVHKPKPSVTNAVENVPETPGSQTTPDSTADIKSETKPENN